mmetsp:Transcript_12477/g.27101  ORF Transcript_12477/g.27101 Transcript_12477/m.27101 type:complete len:166 (+) Transcript_12477:414-911(+)
MKDTEDCSATRLFNGVSLIWSEQINIGTGTGIEGEDESDVADREFRIQENAMTSIRVSPDRVPDQEVDDDAVNDDIGTNKGKVPDYCVEGAWTDGERLMIEENYLEVRVVAMNRLLRKKAVNTFVLDKVEEMRRQSSSTIGTERMNTVRAPWSEVVHSLDPGYFS